MQNQKDSRLRGNDKNMWNGNMANIMQIKFTLAEIAKLIGTELKGDPNSIIIGINTLSNAKNGELTFLDNPRYHKYLAETQASAVILTAKDAEDCKTNALISPNPYLAYAKAAKLFARLPQVVAGAHPTAIIHAQAEIHPSASIGPYCVIAANVTIHANVVIGAHGMISERSIIGADSRLLNSVTIGHDVHIGSRVIIHSGAVIGSDGFGNANEQGRWIKVPQLGGVRIGNDVEIGANTTIDRGAIGDTIIEDGVRLDNQIQIAHNVQIGAHTAIAACTGIAGSTKIGRYCLIGGAVGIAGHIEITDKVMITGQSGITNSIKEPGVYSSTMPAMPQQDWWKLIAYFRKIAELAKRLRKLEKLFKPNMSESE